MRALRAMLEAGAPISCALGTIERESGELQHWEVNDDGDLMVSVVLHQHAQPVWCVVGALAGGAGRGVWAIPPEGCEVLVAFDGGVEGEGVVVGVLPSGDTPELALDQVLVIGAEVLVYNTLAAAAVPLATRADVEALAGHVDAHTHPVAGITAGSASVVSGAPADPSPAPAGTTVLRAE